MKKPAVAVSIVTHNCAEDLPGCFEALAAQTHRPLEVVAVDCASRDETPAVARRLRPGELPYRFLPLPENRGFAGGMNAAIAACEAPFVLSLNADARPAPGFVEALLARMEAPGPGPTGAVTGRLIRPPEPGKPPLLDACGMRLTLTWRHLDRGSGEPDRSQYADPERVFGATGAGTLYRREALLDVAFEDSIPAELPTSEATPPDSEDRPREIFDGAFHSFREDAELAFRLRERGWEVLYEPAAQAEHRRLNVPSRRRAMSAAINAHSLKNRYLLRAYHQGGFNFLLTLLPALARDLGAFGWVLLFERSSLAAYRWLVRHRRAILRRRRWLRARRTVPQAAVDRWFFRRGEPL